MNASEIQLSDQQLRDLRQIFDWLDASGDEHITAEELLLALKASSPSATIEDAAEAIRNATGSTKTTLTWMEFVSVIEKALRKKDGSTAAQMFEMVRCSNDAAIALAPHSSPHLMHESCALPLNCIAHAPSSTSKVPASWAPMCYAKLSNDMDATRATVRSTS